MEEEEFPQDARQEEALLGRLVEAARGLRALPSLGDRRQEVAAEGGRGLGGGTGDEGQRICELLHLLRGVSVSHSVRATSWRETLRECVCVLATPPPGGSDRQPLPTGDSGSFWATKGDVASQVVNHVFPGGDHQDDVLRVLLSVEEDVQKVTDTLLRILAKLTQEVLRFHQEEPGDAASPEQLEDHQSGHVRLGPDSNVTSRPLDAQPAAESSSKVDESGAEPVEDSTLTDGVLQDTQRDNVGGTSETMEGGDLIVG